MNVEHGLARAERILLISDELEATTARDTASVELWVPLPKQVGKYIIRSTLRIDGSDIASATSDEFE